MYSELQYIRPTLRCDVVNTSAYHVLEDPAVPIFRIFYPEDGSSKTLVMTEVKGVIFHKRVITILTFSDLLLFNSL
jgi:hypothetical protein